MDSADSLLLKMLTSTSLPLTNPDFARVETSTSAEDAGEDYQTIGEGLPILLSFPRITFLARFLEFVGASPKISQFVSPDDLKCACTISRIFLPACCLADFLHTASKIFSYLKKIMPNVEKRIILWS
jgi:hypothetical protein